MSSLPKGPALIRALLVLVAIALAFAAPELWARRQERGWNIELVPGEPGRKYALKPQEGIVNSEGFRERELPKEKPPGELRVALLGDSVSFGGGLEDDQVASRVAERILQERGLNVRILNFAVHGYDVEQIAATLRWRGWAYQPDVVVYAAYTNDADPTSVMALDVDGTPVYVGTQPYLGVLPGGLASWLTTRSALFRRYRGAKVARQIAERAGANGGFDVEFFEEHLGEMRDDAAAHAVPLLVWGLAPHVLATADPARCWPGGAAGFCEIQTRHVARIQQQVERLGLPYWSGLDALRASGESAFYLPGREEDPHHPNARGHAVLGADLAAMLRAWLGGDRDPFYSERSLRALRLMQSGRIR